VVVVDISDPEHPRYVSQVGSPHIVKPHAISIQFRYAFVVDDYGLKVIDVTFPENPRPVDGAALRIDDARNIYVARTYAHISAGRRGLLIADVERPEHPRFDQVFNAGGTINDLYDTKLAMTNASLYAYLADG